MMTMDVAARVSTGSPMPDGSPGIAGGADVILCNAEDDPGDTLRPRLDAAGADVARVHHLSGVRDDDESAERAFTLADVPALADALEANPDVALVVLDPIGSFISGADSHRDNEVRAMLAPLVKLAADHDVAVLLVMHKRKSVSRNADDTVLGSRAFTGVVRQVWHLARDPDDESKRLMLPGKCNIAAVAEGMRFGIVGDDQRARVAWDRDPVRMTADDAMSAEIDRAAAGGDDEHTARDDAKHLILTVLRDGPREVRELEREAKAAGISITGALRRARGELCERPERDGFGKAGRWTIRLNLAGQVAAREMPDAIGEHIGEQDAPNSVGCSSMGKGAHLWEKTVKKGYEGRSGESADAIGEHPASVGQQSERFGLPDLDGGSR